MLEEYVLIAQVAREAMHFRRANGWRQEKIGGENAKLALDSLNLRLPLALIYQVLLDEITKRFFRAKRGWTQLSRLRLDIVFAAERICKVARVIFENVSKIFSAGRIRAVTAVRELSFSIEAREFLVLTGPSGCGKTTTLRLIAGLEKPTTGKVLLDGKPLESLPIEVRDIAMVFQNGALYPHMTVFENLAFGMKVRNLSGAEIRVRVKETASWLELEGCLDRLPRELSGGQAQRLAIGRALVRRPGIILFDEPFSNVDAQLRARLREDLQKLHDQLKATFVYVTHDQVEAMTLGTKLLVMEKGQQAQVDSPQEIYDSPENLFVARFFGSPGMNLISGVLSRRGDRIWFQAARDTPGILFEMVLPHGILPLNGPIPEKAIFGIRPEGIAEHAVGEANDPAVSTGTVKRVRSIGWETQAELDIAGITFVARMPRASSLQPGQITALAFDLSMLHLFDADTGRRLNQPVT